MLILSLSLNTSNTVLGENGGSGEKRYLSLLKIYGKAKERLLNVANKVDSMVNIRETVEKADALVQEAKSLAEKGEYMDASLKVLDALRTLKRTYINVFSGLRTESIFPHGVEISIKRHMVNLERVKQVLNKLGERGFNVLTPINLIGKAEKLLQEAVQAFNNGNQLKARELMVEANKLIGNAASMAKRETEALHSKKIKMFVRFKLEGKIAELKELVKRIYEKNPDLAREIDEELTQIEMKMREAVERGNIEEARKLMSELGRMHGYVMKQVKGKSGVKGFHEKHGMPSEK